MAKAVFTTKAMPSYDDLPERQYHFPQTYLNHVRQTIGDYIVYYEPRRSTADLSSSGGRQSYFGVARVRDVVEDASTAGHYYARVDEYLDFDRPVPFVEGSLYYESALRKDDGTTNRGAFGRSVRIIPDREFNQICKAGFAPILIAPELAVRTGLAELPASFERPIIETIVFRPFRERSFMHNVRKAYSNRCAITGLRLINGGGRPEVQAAHIQPVASQGPDAVRNGIALSGTMHWMFDRGLVSISDDYKILIAENHVPEDARLLLNKSGKIYLPEDETMQPNAHYLKFHRENVFKG